MHQAGPSDRPVGSSAVTEHMAMEADPGLDAAVVEEHPASGGIDASALADGQAASAGSSDVSPQSSSGAAESPSVSAASSMASGHATPSKHSRSGANRSSLLTPAAVRFALALPALAAFTAWLLRAVRSRGADSSSAAPRAAHRRKQHNRAVQQHAEVVAAIDEAPEPESTLELYASDFQLPTEQVQLVARPAALEGLTCVIAEHIPIQGATISCGVAALRPQLPTAQTHASITQKLLNKGFSIIGQGSTQPFNYPTLGTNLRNPVSRYRVAGGGATGAVGAIAQHHAHLAVGTDWQGSVRIPAACQGLYALVCTPGVYAFSSQGPVFTEQSAADAAPQSSSAGSNGGSRRGSNGGLEAAGFVVGDMGVLRRVGEHLALPGVSDLRGDLTQVVVAEDLFSLCEPEMEAGLLCMKRAVLHWAGQEQAGSVQLLPFLESNCRSWTALAAAADASGLASVTTGSGRPLPPVLRALTYAASLLHHHSLAQRYGSLAAAAAAAAAEAASDGQEQQQQQGQPYALLGLDASVAAALEAGGGVQQQQLDDAWQLLQDVQDLLNTAVKHDVVVVLPITPSPPPRIDAPPAALHSWLVRCHAFASLTALGGCPTVVLPVSTAGAAAGAAAAAAAAAGAAGRGGGGAPLSIALFGHSRSDQRLLTVAERLAVFAQAEFRKLQEQSAADAAAAAGGAAAEAAANGERQHGQGKGKAKKQQQQQRQQRQPELVDPKRLAKADKAKARGNEAFKLGKYSDAIKAYSEASKLDPTNPVYLSNRALCYLRLFSFEAAEADCNAVLAFTSLAPPDRVKALLRRGTARIHKNELGGAAEDFKAVLALEPNNRQAREELKAMQQQQRELQDEQRRALASRLGSNGGGPGSNGAAAAAAGLPFLHPQGGDAMFSDPVAAAAAAAAAGELSPQEFEAMQAMLQSGSLPVVLGDEGQPVVGPQGEPVIVGPGGQSLTVGPSGGMQPFVGRRKTGGY